MDIVFDGKSALGVTSGDATDAYVGFSIAGVGDVDGDGFADILIGNTRRNQSPALNGLAYLLWGSTKFLGSGSVSLAEPDGATFIILFGWENDGLGYSVAGGADLNGDGRPDFTIGAPFAKYTDGTATGASYTLFGHARPWPGGIFVRTLDGSNGFIAYGSNGASAANEEVGFSTALLQHFSDSTYGQLVLGAPEAFVTGDSGLASGRVDFLYGRSTFEPYYSLGSYPIGSKGFAISGGTSLTYNEAALGAAVASAGDVNHDGYEDLIIGAPADASTWPGAGTAFVLYGHPGSTLFGFDLGTLDGTTGFHIQTDSFPYANGGKAVGTLGDINGDGIDDFFVTGGTSLNTAGCWVNVVFGRNSAFPANFDAAASMDGTQGFYVMNLGQPNALGELYCTGISVAGVGDVNGDGIDDFVVGDTGPVGPFGGDEIGVAYLVFGHHGTWNPLTPSNMTHRQGSVIASSHVASHDFGKAVAKLGDVNGDGIADFAIGAPTDGMAGNKGGVVIVVFGRDGIFDNGFN